MALKQFILFLVKPPLCEHGRTIPSFAQMTLGGSYIDHVYVILPSASLIYTYHLDTCVCLCVNLHSCV